MTVCKNCPFRKDSSLGFCEDGLEALALDLTPSCHEAVGAGNQFIVDDPDDTQRCHGYVKWQSGHKGFARPHPLRIESEHYETFTIRKLDGF